MRRFVTAITAALIGSASSAQPQPAAGPPKLLIVISVDQFSADLFDEISPLVHGGTGADGEGTAFPQRLSRTGRDRDLPGPFGHPDRLASGANRHHLQPLVRPVDRAGPTRTSIARKTSVYRAAIPPIISCRPVHLKVPVLGEF